MIHGENDPLMPLPAAQWLAEHLPDARLEIFKSAAHALLLSAPGRFAELLIDYCHALPPIKQRVRESLDRAAVTYDGAAVLQRRVCDRLLDGLSLTGRPQRILDAGCGTGYGSRCLRQRWPDTTLPVWTLPPPCLSWRAMKPIPARSPTLSRRSPLPHSNLTCGGRA